MPSRAEDCAPSQSAGVQQDMTKGCSKHSTRHHHISNEIGRIGSSGDELHLWADALPVLRDRLPAVTEEILAHWDFGPRRLRQAKLVGADPLLFSLWTLGNGNMVGSTTRLPFLNITFGRPKCMPRRPGSLEVALRPRFGSGSPTGPEFQVQPLQFRTLVLERLRLPLILTEPGAWRSERHFWKTLGHLLTVWQVEKTRRAHRGNGGREAGATVTRNVKLRDMNVQVRQLTKERSKL